MNVKGIVLAGGSGSRLYPLTEVVCKQLLPVYDKPMIYYPISTLLLAGIRDILIISTPKDLPMIQGVLGDGSRLGVRFTYAEQPRPEGIAQSFVIGEDFIGDDAVCLILGDNVFYGDMEFLRRAVQFDGGATIFAYRVNNPERYGVVEFDAEGNALSLEEKPREPKSSYAVTGLYLYDNRVVDIAKRLKPSKRGELEITDINNVYLNQGQLRVEKMDRGMAWLDMGTQRALLDASNFIASLEFRQGLKIGCLEEIAFRMGRLSAEGLRELIASLRDSQYRSYLKEILDECEADGSSRPLASAGERFTEAKRR